MELKEQGKGWCLAFRDASVHLIQIDFSLSLFFLDPPNEVTVIIGGPTLEVDPDPRYEAWQLASSTMDFLLVCAPGGAVARFKDRARGSH